MGIVSHDALEVITPTLGEDMAGKRGGTDEMRMNVFSNASASSVMPLGNDIQVTAEVLLEPELFNSLLRRGRRRLKDIQASCQVNMRLDKLHGVLHITGSEHCVGAARHLIAGLGGPRKIVRKAVWAELLRTRTLQSGEEANVARIQQESGCRIHIERSRQEVRLFGHAEAIAIAEKLLKELDQECIEKTVPMKVGASTSPALQALAHSCGVTLQLEENQILVLGLQDSVNEAVKDLNRYLHDADFRSGLQLSAETAQENEVNSIAFPSEKNTIKGECPTCGSCPFCASCGAPRTFANQIQNQGGHANSANAALPSAPWQQMPTAGYSSNMVQISAMVSRDMAQPGFVPAICMVPANMAPPSGQQQMIAPSYMMPTTMLANCAIGGQMSQPVMMNMMLP
jgi:hypothetical protein